MGRSFLIAGAAAVLVGGAGAAALAQAPKDPSMGPPPTKVTGYFKSNPLDGKAILGPPPAPDSPRGRADRAVFEQTRSLKDSPRWKEAIEDNDLWAGGALHRFSCAIGVEIDARQTPALWKILHKVELDVRTIGTPAKDFYGRKRPLIGNDAPICVPREAWMETNASYPSGHSMTAWSWALIMAEARPSKADAALTLGRELRRQPGGLRRALSDRRRGRARPGLGDGRAPARPAGVRRGPAARHCRAGQAKRAPRRCSAPP